MRTAWIAVVVLAVAVGCAPQGPAEEETAPSETEAPAGTETSAADVDGARVAVEDLIADTADALTAQDWQAAEGMITEDWTFYGSEGRWDFARFRQFFEDHITDHTITFSDVSVEVADDASMAWASFHEETAYAFDGEPVEESAVFTTLFRNTADGWRLARLHRTVLAPAEVEATAEQ